MIRGTVNDPSGAPLPRAQVTAMNLVTNTRFETTTKDQGSYELENLIPGRYKLEVAASNFLTVSREVQVDAGASLSEDFQLALQPLAESITVAETADIAKAELAKVPGGTFLVQQIDLERSRAHNLQDVLAFAPGVIAQSRFGADESQLSIRGSGLRNNFHMRGINLLINGLPYQDADGFSDFESIDLLSVRDIQVWKGANALRFGGNSMGGAINFVTQTGETASPLQVRVEGGSFGLFKAQLSSGGVHGPFSYFVSASDTELDGYRAHSQQGRQRVFGNVGWRLDERTELRLDLIYANVAEKLPGSVTRDEFRADPRQANPVNVQQDQGRFYNYVRLGVGFKRQLDSRQELAVNIYGQYRNVDHPIFQVLDQDQRNFGGEVRYRFEGLLGGRRNRLVVGFAPQIGDNGERRFANVNGQRGNLISQFDAEAKNYGLYFEEQLDVVPALTLIFGGRADWARREFKDLFLSDGDRSDRRTYRAFSPKIGLVWQARESLQVFGNVSRSYEAPLLLELTSFGAPGFLDLEAQDTWQFELGTRGQLRGRLNWDVALFDAEVDNEILNINLQPFPSAPFTVPSYRNAPNTRHLGLELGAGATLKQSLLQGGDQLSWRMAYTWSQLRFVDDPSFGNNDLPGAPRHRLTSELRYEHPTGFWIAPSLDWSPASYFVDSANTARNDQYAVLNFKVGYDWRRIGFYFEAFNLTDRNYSGSVQVDNALGRYFEPANGRSLYGGLRWRY
ncbi:MAG: TonB-dependent receptor [Acidobacteria bacterium]|nr:TonB-dependent receptor [Acidobacteriota bacterium]